MFEAEIGLVVDDQRRAVEIDLRITGIRIAEEGIDRRGGRIGRNDGIAADRESADRRNAAIGRAVIPEMLVAQRDEGADRSGRHVSVGLTP